MPQWTDALMSKAGNARLTLDIVLGVRVLRLVVVDELDDVYEGVFVQARKARCEFLHVNLFGYQ